MTRSQDSEYGSPRTGPDKMVMASKAYSVAKRRAEEFGDAMIKQFEIMDTERVTMESNGIHGVTPSFPAAPTQAAWIRHSGAGEPPVMELVDELPVEAIESRRA